MPRNPTYCHEDPAFRPCCCCERGMSQNVTYAFPNRHTVLCLCTQCAALGFVLLPDGTVERELEAAA